MAINKISGNILQDNLQRGANLAIQGNLLYVNITDTRIGINTSATTHTLTVLGNASISNDFTAGSITTTGNVSVGNISVTGEANVGTTLNVTGNATVGNLDTAGQITAVGNISSGNIITLGIVDASGNITGANIFSLGDISGAGNIIGGNIISNALISGVTLSLTGNATVGNLQSLGEVTATGNISGGNLSITGTADITGNVTGGNISTVGDLTVTGNTSTGNLDSSGAITAVGNISGGNLSGNLITGTLTTNAQPNITSVGTLIDLTVSGNANVGNLDTTGTITAVGNISGGNLSGNLITGTLTTNAQPNITSVGNLSTLTVLGVSTLGNLEIANTTITTNQPNGNIIIDPIGTGVVSIDTTTGLGLPTGNTAQRPATPNQGTVRFNTSTTQVEVWDGTQWTVVGSDYASITNQYITGDDVTTVFTLDQSTTASAIIVSTNGVIQFPDIAYTVTGNQITFVEAPQSTDIIDVRFTSIVTTVNAITNSVGQGLNITAPGVVDASNSQSIKLPSYTVSQATALGNVSAGQVIYVSNGDSGSPCLAVYDGSAWRRVALGSTIST